MARYSEVINIYGYEQIQVQFQRMDNVTYLADGISRWYKDVHWPDFRLVLGCKHSPFIHHIHNPIHMELFAI